MALGSGNPGCEAEFAAIGNARDRGLAIRFHLQVEI